MVSPAGQHLHTRTLLIPFRPPICSLCRHRFLRKVIHCRDTAARFLPSNHFRVNVCVLLAVSTVTSLPRVPCWLIRASLDVRISTVSRHPVSGPTPSVRHRRRSTVTIYYRSSIYKSGYYMVRSRYMPTILGDTRSTHRPDPCTYTQATNSTRYSISYWPTSDWYPGGGPYRTSCIVCITRRRFSTSVRRPRTAVADSGVRGGVAPAPLGWSELSPSIRFAADAEADVCCALCGTSTASRALPDAPSDDRYPL